MKYTLCKDRAEVAVRWCGIEFSPLICVDCAGAG